MEQLIDQVTGFLGASWHRFSLLDRTLLLVNFAVLVLAKPMIDRFGDRGTGSSHMLQLLRAGTLLFILFLVFYNAVLSAEEHTFVTRLLGVILVIYVGYLAMYFSHHFIRRRFGRRRELGGESFLSETYNSRLLGLVSGAVIFALVLVAIVEILGFDDLLHASGVLGVVGVMLALTQSSWAPDLISGLIILNNRLLEEGDVVELGNGEQVIGMVFRTKMFHTELLDLSRNHRILLQNAKLRGMTIRNLSKFASAKGLRERLEFNVGYNVSPKAVQRMVESAFARLEKESGFPVEFSHGFDLHPVAAADYSVTWSLFYHIKELRQLITTRYRINAALVEAAAEHGVQLATPVLISAPAALAAASAAGGAEPAATPVAPSE